MPGVAVMKIYGVNRNFSVDNSLEYHHLLYSFSSSTALEIKS